jgi:hypothetical protein
MIEPMIVSNALAFPMVCKGCGTQKGPFIDYHVEDVAGHFYLCVNLCVKTGARLAGFFEGAKLDELQSAASTVNGLERERDSLSGQLSVAEEMIAKFQRVSKERDEYEEQLEARVKQLEGNLRENAQNTLSLVGDPEA